MKSLALTELTSEEMIAIDGGKPYTYYIGLAIGATVGTAVSFIAGLLGGLSGEHL
jgi:hypothetical protein